jgi:hypothetical protein
MEIKGNLYAGEGSSATGLTTFAFGVNVTASGDYSHAEGYQTTASGNTSHAEGHSTIASGDYSHAEGWQTNASGFTSHAEGGQTKAFGSYSHAEGFRTTASGFYSHAEGGRTTASGFYSHAEGQTTTASGDQSHAGGQFATASGVTSFIHSTNSLVTGARSVVLGGQNITGTTNDTVYTPIINANNNIYTQGDFVIQTNLIDPETLASAFESSDVKGYYQLYDYTGATGFYNFNTSLSGSTGILFGQSAAPNPRKFGLIRYVGDNFLRDSATVNGNDFYQNKVIYQIGANTNGTVVTISPSSNNGRYWFEQNGNSPMVIAGGGAASDIRLGIALNPNGTEIPTAQLQVGGTSTTGTFRYIDGNQQSGYILTSDANGNASWQVSTITGDTNFANTDLTFNGDRNHNTNGNHLAITTDNGLYNEGWIYLDNTLDGNNGSWIGYSSNHVRSYNQGNEISSSDGVFANVVEFFSGGTTFNTNTIPGVYFNVQTNSDQYSLYVDGTSGNVGIGIDTPTEKLDVSGKTKTINFQMTSGATNGYVLTSDANGNATWAETNMVNTNYNPTGNTITTSDNYVRYDLTGDTVVNLPSTAGSTPTPKEGQVLNIIKIGPNKLTLETSVTNSIQGAPDGQSPTPFTSGNALDLLSTNTVSVTLIYDGGLDSWVIMSCSDYNQIEYKATL